MPVLSVETREAALRRSCRSVSVESVVLLDRVYSTKPAIRELNRRQSDSRIAVAVGYLSPTVPVRSVWPACVSHARGRPPWPIDVPKETPRCRQTVSPVAGRSFALGQTRVRSKTATDGCGSFAPSRGRWVDSLWGSPLAPFLDPGSNRGSGVANRRSERDSLAATKAIWLILPVVICLSQRLSHACLSINFYTVKLRMAH